VVGAGTGGCTTARVAAEAGFNVCLIDRKLEKDIGRKVCGDAIGKHHFDNLGLAYPSGDELERTIRGIRIYSPSTEAVFTLEGEGIQGFTINRHLFGQRLLKNAVDAGASLMASTQVVKPIVENGFVTGVLVRRVEKRDKIQLNGKIIVDASGFTATLRSALPQEVGVDTNIRKEDAVVCYREIRELKREIEDPEYFRVYLSKAVAPGGYCWIIPKEETKINVGLGVTMSGGFPNPKKQLYNYALLNPLFERSKVIHGGTWYVPTRRPLDCMAGNGILLVGDAACQANPLHGGGMGPSMIGGTLAGKAITEALERGDVSQNSLWSYNVKYMQAYGAKQASLDVVRLFLQGLEDKDLDYIMKYRLITEDDLLKASMGERIRLNITDITMRIFRGLGRISFLRRLRALVDLTKEVTKLYQNYPTSPKNFDVWRKKAHELIERARKI